MFDKIIAYAEFIWTTIIWIVYPPICPVCQKISDEYHNICKDCAKKILRLDAEKNPPAPLNGVFRVTKYRGGTRELLHKLKFKNNLRVLPALKKILEKTSDDEKIKSLLAKIDAATCVPLHEKRLKERGYNQTELIFKDWLAAQNIPLENLLTRNKPTEHLFKFNPAERREILKGAFDSVDGVDVAGKNILIVDDIFTTGATTAECARVLKKIGAAEIYVLALSSDFGE